jgi:hypothetical protein
MRMIAGATRPGEIFFIWNANFFLKAKSIM